MAFAVISVTLYCLLLTFNIWFFLIRPKVSLTEKITVLLLIIGAYTFTFGMLDQSGILTKFEVIAQDMTSPNIYRFMAGNGFALSIFSHALGTGLQPDKVNLPISYPLEAFIMTIIAILSVLFTIFYIVVVLPLSYLAYVIVSIPVSAIMTSGTDVNFTIGNSTTSITISLNEFVTQNTVTIKNLLIAIPLFILSLMPKMARLLKGSLYPNFITQKIKHLFSTHPRMLNISLFFVQALVMLLIIFHVIFTSIIPIIHPSMEQEQKGEFIGILIVSILILIIFVLLYLKVRRVRKSFIKR